MTVSTCRPSASASRPSAAAIALAGGSAGGQRRTRQTGFGAVAQTVAVVIAERGPADVVERSRLRSATGTPLQRDILHIEDVGAIDQDAAAAVNTARSPAKPGGILEPGHVDHPRPSAGQRSREVKRAVGPGGLLSQRGAAAAFVDDAGVGQRNGHAILPIDRTPQDAALHRAGRKGIGRPKLRVDALSAKGKDPRRRAGKPVAVGKQEAQGVRRRGVQPLDSEAAVRCRRHCLQQPAAAADDLDAEVVCAALAALALAIAVEIDENAPGYLADGDQGQILVWAALAGRVISGSPVANNPGGGVGRRRR